MPSAHALALAVAAVIERQDPEAEAAQAGVVLGAAALGQVPRVAVADQNPERVRRIRRGMDDPGRQCDPVFGAEPHLRRLEAEAGRWRREAARRTGGKDQPRLHRPDQ